MTDAEKRIREALAAGPTPGPWSVETVPTSCGICHKVGPFPGKRPDDPPRHACLYADYPSRGNPADDELKANADFIAACHPAAISELLAERDALAAENERKDELLQQLRQWSEAYPLDIFPEPDFARAHAVLQAAGMTLDAISASNMRHVITKVREMIDAARGKE